jgi:hypothetical protein
MPAGLLSSEMVSFRRSIFAALLLLSFSAAPLAQVRQPSKEPSGSSEPTVPLEQWLAGPDRTDIPAEFKVLNPRFTFNQRYLVECRAAISGEIARGRELHIWVKVADHSGAWLPGHDYSFNLAAPSLTKKNEVQFVGGFYALPGQYTVAMIVYDGKSKQYDVRHLPVTVKPIENDPLAGHVETAKPVDFFVDQPPGGNTFQRIGDVNKDEPDWLWPFAHELDTYPVNSGRPVQIDIVLNFSDAGEAVNIPDIPVPRMRRYPSIEPRILPPPPEVKVQQRQKEYIGALLTVAQVLASIRPANGCVRISGMDILDMQEVLHRMAPEQVEWEKIQRYRTTEKLAEVSVAALKNRKEQPNFVRNYLKDLQSPIENCGTGSEPPLHTVIVVSHPYVFPSGSHKENFKFENDPTFRFYHFLLNVGSKGVYDDLGSYLKSAGAKTQEINTPHDLREAMARTISDFTKSQK